MLEIRKRAFAALLDARHRLRTGRPRGGMPGSYVHPPLPCSHGCSKPAQRVHGLLYGYSLAYSEVRPRVETIAEVLGCGTSTVRNALGELRRAGLLVVHERRGKDQRRLANRYEVRVPPARRAPLSAGGPPAEPQRTRSKISDLRSKNEKDSRRPAAMASAAPAPKSAPSRACSLAAVSEEVFAEAVGPECLRRLRAHFSAELGELLQVVALERGLELPGALRAACDQLVEARGSVEKPAGYLRATLRGQRALEEGLRRDVAELGARLQGFLQSDERERVAQVRGEIAKVQRRLAEMRSVTATCAGPVSTRPGRAPQKLGRAPTTPAEPVSLDECLKGATQVLEGLRRARTTGSGH